MRRGFINRLIVPIICICFFFPPIAGYGQWIKSNGPKATVTRTLAAKGNIVFAGTDNGMFRSVNNGSCWTPINSRLPATDTVLSMAVVDSFIFIGTLHDGIFRSADNGDSWISTNNGFPKDSGTSNDFCSVSSISVIGSSMLAGTFQKGIFLSTDKGESWQPMNSGLTNLNVFALISSGNDFFSGNGMGGGVFLSSNAGITWTKANNGLFYIDGMVYSVLGLIATKNSLFAVTLYGGIYSSQNKGQTWNSANSGLSTNNVLSLFPYSDTLFAGTDLDGVFISSNNGTSWTSFSANLPQSDAVLCFCVSNGMLLAGLYGSGVWRRQLFDMTIAGSKSPQKRKLEASISSSQGLVRYTVPIQGIVSIKYYDLQGRLLASFVNRVQSAGTYSVVMPAMPKGFFIRDFRVGDFTLKERVN